MKDESEFSKRRKISSKKQKKTPKTTVTRKSRVKAQTKTKVEPKKENLLTVDGTKYSPISLRKFIENLEKKDHFKIVDNSPLNEAGCLTVLINNTGNGLDIDGADTFNVTIQDRVKQTAWFIDEHLEKLPRLPAYLYRYVQWVMVHECNYSKDYENKMKYPTDNDYIQAINSGTLKTTDKEYQEVYGMIKWGKSNTELTHLIGLIQIVGGSMMAAAKRNSGVRFFVELPETGFHPKRERLLISLLIKLKEEYGIKKDWTST